MKQKLKEIREALLNALNELDELIEKEDKAAPMSRPIDPPPPDKPKG